MLIQSPFSAHSGATIIALDNSEFKALKVYLVRKLILESYSKLSKNLLPCKVDFSVVETPTNPWQQTKLHLLMKIMWYDLSLWNSGFLRFLKFEFKLLSQKKRAVRKTEMWTSTIPSELGKLHLLRKFMWYDIKIKMVLETKWSLWWECLLCYPRSRMKCEPH